MKKFRLTFTHGLVLEFEADCLDDSGVRLSLMGPNDTIVYRIADSEIMCCEDIGASITEDHSVEETNRGVQLRHSDGSVTAAYRNYQ